MNLSITGYYGFLGINLEVQSIQCWHWGYPVEYWR